MFDESFKYLNKKTPLSERLEFNVKHELNKTNETALTQGISQEAATTAVYQNICLRQPVPQSISKTTYNSDQLTTNGVQEPVISDQWLPTTSQTQQFQFPCALLPLQFLTVSVESKYYSFK